MIDISAQIDPYEVPLCPLCDCTIREPEEVVLAQAHGDKFLAHAECVAPYVEEAA